MSFWDSLFGSEGEVQTQSTMTKDQRDLMKKGTEYAMGQIGQGLPQWGEAFTAPLSQYEQMGLSKLGEYLNAPPDPNSISSLSSEAYKRGISGLTPQEAEAFHMKHYDPMVQRYMQQELIPGFKESMVPGGNLRSSGTERGLGQIYGEMGATRMRDIGDLYKWSQEQSAKLLPYARDFEWQEGGIPQIEAAMKYGALPRLIEQQELSSRIEDTRQSYPQLNPILDFVSNLLGTQTKTGIYKPGQTGLVPQIAGGLSTGLGYAWGGG